MPYDQCLTLPEGTLHIEKNTALLFPQYPWEFQHQTTQANDAAFFSSENCRLFASYTREPLFSLYGEILQDLSLRNWDWQLTRVSRDCLRFVFWSWHFPPYRMMVGLIIVVQRCLPSVDLIFEVVLNCFARGREAGCVTCWQN